MYMSIRLFINYYNLMGINENGRVDNSWERWKKGENLSERELDALSFSIEVNVLERHMISELQNTHILKKYTPIANSTKRLS